MGTAHYTEKVLDKPFYCFKFDSETGKVEKLTINEYWVTTSYFTGRKVYSFDAPPRITKESKRYTVSGDKFERFVTGKVFTFNPDLDNALAIIDKEIDTRIDKAFSELVKYQDLKSTFQKANNLIL